MSQVNSSTDKFKLRVIILLGIQEFCFIRGNISVLEYSM